MSGATVRGVAETLTEKEALTLEAIARGENPCARIGEENTSITGTRRRLVTGLRKKGMVGPDSPNGGMPALTDKGRAFIAGRADTEPPTEAPC